MYFARIPRLVVRWSEEGLSIAVIAVQVRFHVITVQNKSETVKLAFNS